VPWFDASAPLRAAASICGVTPDELLSDSDAFGRNIFPSIVRERMVLSEPEQAELRSLGALAARALEAGIDGWQPGETSDFEIASVISRELERCGAKAVCLIVGGDDRLRSVRHPSRSAPSCTARSWRSWSHGEVAFTWPRRARPSRAPTTRYLNSPKNSNRSTGPSYARHCPVTLGRRRRSPRQGYENIGQPGAWREHFQGGPIAFEQREFELAPTQTDSPYWDLDCLADTAVAWNPSLRGGAKIEETYLVSNDGFELLTSSGAWATTANDGGMQHSQVKVVQ